MVAFEWIDPPENLELAIDDYFLRCRVGLWAAANKWGMEMQVAARQGATWEDRTGNARGGLFFAVDGFGMGTMQGEVDADARALLKDTEVTEGDANTIVIVLAHTVFYGKFLELSNGGKYAIIMSTLEANLPALERLVEQAYGH